QHHKTAHASSRQSHMEYISTSSEAQEQCRVIRSLPTAEALETMNLERLAELETINSRPLPPWRAEPFTEIEIQIEKRQGNGLRMYDPRPTLSSTQTPLEARAI